jgi:phosphoribosyl 1,2-cyclic phosphodiesterase
MQIRIWGARGSLPSPMTSEQLQDKLRSLLQRLDPADLADDEHIDAFLAAAPEARLYGGNTSCVEVQVADEIFVFDAGSGIRAFGADLMQRTGSTEIPLRCFLTHFHWDHICGFPFFPPIYMPGRELQIYSGRSDSERLLAGQMADAYFPVKWPHLTSRISCQQLAVGQDHPIGPARVRLMKLIHPDQAYGYRVDHGGRSFCYLTDTEVSKQPNAVAQNYADFVAGADVVIVDAMYGFLSYHEHINFGHSTVFNWVDFFRDAAIGELVIFHHDPLASDADIDALVEQARRYAGVIAPESGMRISAAAEGRMWDLPEAPDSPSQGSPGSP